MNLHYLSNKKNPVYTAYAFSSLLEMIDSVLELDEEKIFGPAIEKSVNAFIGFISSIPEDWVRQLMAQEDNLLILSIIERAIDKIQSLNESNVLTQLFAISLSI